jgi:hypothetical protein
MEEGLTNIVMIPYERINKFDVTESLQVRYDVRVFNEKIGLLKDSTNEIITNTSYNPTNNTFPVDSISLTASEFLLGMNSTTDF